MKTYIVIEADTTMHSLFAFVATRELDSTGDNYIYTRPAGAEPAVQEIDLPKFFGKLNALLPTKDTVNRAEPMKLVTPGGKQ